MVSAWWVLGAFVGGFYAGMLLMALMSIAAAHSNEDEQSLDNKGPI